MLIRKKGIEKCGGCDFYRQHRRPTSQPWIEPSLSSFALLRESSNLLFSVNNFPYKIINEKLIEKVLAAGNMAGEEKDQDSLKSPYIILRFLVVSTTLDPSVSCEDIYRRLKQLLVANWVVKRLLFFVFLGSWARTQYAQCWWWQAL